MRCNLSPFVTWLRNFKNALTGRRRYRRPVQHVPSYRPAVDYLEDRSAVGENIGLSGALMAAAGIGAVGYVIPAAILRILDRPPAEPQANLALVDARRLASAGPEPLAARSLLDATNTHEALPATPPEATVA